MQKLGKPAGTRLGSVPAAAHLKQQPRSRLSTQSPIQALPADHQQTHTPSLPRRSLALALTGLAALAPSTCLAASRKGSKRTGLSIQELMDITADDVGRKKSLVTGQVDQSIYDDKLDFGDPSGMQGIDWAHLSTFYMGKQETALPKQFSAMLPQPFLPAHAWGCLPAQLS